MNEASFVSTLAGVAAADAADRVLAGELGLGQVEQYIMGAMSKFFDKYGGQIAEKFSAVAEPAAKKAAEIIGPVVEQKLKDYGPTFGIITGSVIGLSLLIGGYYFGKKMSPRRRAA